MTVATERLSTLLQKYLERLGLDLDPQRQARLLAFLGLLLKWNQAYNLTAIREPEAMLMLHIADSLAVLKHLPAGHYADVGSGPGIPAIPLAIASDALRFTTLDSAGKKIRFQVQACHELGIASVEPVHGRVEDYTTRQFDGVISRAFASLRDMLEWCGHLSDSFYAMKGQYPHEEIADLPPGYWVAEVIPLSLPDPALERHLVVIRKQTAVRPE
ncbi:MAG: 16S rRNA (guanine(527)-N(7))-methyltransferase RsmG [Gammaproteobacteria bacterium]|nr:16S rRNA (guanine(527)-N(7))-methyltransferase RsmG [Gammaproteobacteria bacterium]